MVWLWKVKLILETSLQMFMFGSEKMHETPPTAAFKPDVIRMHPGLPRILDFIPRDTKSLLDAGCGRGVVGAACRIYRHTNRLTGIDAYQPYVTFCEQCGFYDAVLMRDLTDPLPFSDKEYDVVTSLEVIEHLPQASGDAFIRELERVAGLVIITTPNLFFHQAHFDGNPFQEHRSYWPVKEFKKRGYKCYGVGPMLIFGKPRKLISYALTNCTYYTPELSVYILCVKNTRTPNRLESGP
jgi:2-polyprenyl-3-methyl-5-hydroxy-6-metoxy-1,4-benzoquinol methylase